MQNTLGPLPAPSPHPHHDKELGSDPSHRRAGLQATSPADSRETLRLAKSKNGGVSYLAAEDVRCRQLRASDAGTACSFKAEAAFVAAAFVAAEIVGELTVSGRFYPQACDEVTSLAGDIAFHVDCASPQLPDTNA